MVRLSTSGEYMKFTPATPPPQARPQAQEDAHLIVVAYGENSDLRVGYGSSAQAGIRPCAYNNPIFIDIDGNGFRPNGDNLDWPLPTGALTLPAVKAMSSQKAASSRLHKDAPRNTTRNNTTEHEPYP